MSKEELTKLLIKSYDRGVEDAKQEALAALEKTVAVMVAAQLAQQEPVAWWDSKLGVFDEKHFDQLQPLYTSPQPAKTSKPWVGLTDEEISEIAINTPPMVHEFARAIEAKLKEKNT